MSDQASFPVGPTPPAFTELPPPQTLPPPPSRGIAWWLWPLTLVLMAGVILMQRPAPPDPAKVEQLKKGVTVEPPGVSPMAVIGKLLLGVRQLLPHDNMNPATLVNTAKEMAEQTESAQDRFRAAILAGEAGGEKPLREQLDKLRPDLDAASPLHSDIDTVLGAYDGQDASDPLVQDARKALVDRHGWFGSIALEDAAAVASSGGTTGTPSSDPASKPAPPPPSPSEPARSRVASDGLTLLFVFGALGLGMFLLLLGGVLLMIVGAVLLSQRRLVPAGRYAIEPSAPPAPGPGVWLETLALFLAGFLTLKVCAEVAAHIGGPTATWPVWVVLLGQWLLAPILLWPRVRGLSREEYKAQLGLHSGRGLVREVGAGLAGYAAIIPVYLLMALLVVIATFIAQAITGHKSAPVPENRVLELAGGGPAQLVAIALLVSVWAPLVEETLFRGVVYRLFRGTGRYGRIALGVLGSGVIFAAMHGYILQGLVMVGTLGVCFALIREWRGTLVPTMTAHCVHNTWVFIVLLAVASLAKG